MSSTVRRNRFATLSLVTGAFADELIAAEGHAKPGASIPDGWFRDEVGYVGDTEASAAAHQKQRPA
jgi:hypothetical protein